MLRFARLLTAVAMLGLLAACDSGAPASPTAPPAASPSPPPVAAPPTAPQPTPTEAPAAASPAVPTLTALQVPASPTIDTVAAAAYATITALAQNAAATATAGALPTATASPLPAAPPVPAKALGTYRLIITARAEGYRVFQQPGTLVLSAPQAGSNHSAELQLWTGVRTGREHADLSPGTTVGALYLATSAALLPAGFDTKAPFAVAVRYDPATKYLTITGDPAHGIPGGWSTGPNNKARAPRSITGGTIQIDLGTAGALSGQVDLHSAAAGGPDLLYSGGIQGEKR